MDARRSSRRPGGSPLTTRFLNDYTDISDLVTRRDTTFPIDTSVIARTEAGLALRPNRIFEVGLAAAHGAGLVGLRQVLDSTPLYDPVATMDTVTLIRSARRAEVHRGSGCAGR